MDLHPKVCAWEDLALPSMVVPWKQLTWHLYLAMLKDQPHRIDASFLLPFEIMARGVSSSKKAEVPIFFLHIKC